MPNPPSFTNPDHRPNYGTMPGVPQGSPSIPINGSSSTNDPTFGKSTNALASWSAPSSGPRRSHTYSLRPPVQLAGTWLLAFTLWQLITTFGVILPRLFGYAIPAFVAWVIFRRSVPWKIGLLFTVALLTGIVEILVGDVLWYVVVADLQGFNVSFEVRVPAFIASAGIVGFGYWLASLTNPALRGQIAHFASQARRGVELPAALGLALLLAAAIFMPVRALTGSWTFSIFEWVTIDNYRPNGHSSLNMVERDVRQGLTANGVPVDDVDCDSYTTYENENIIDYECSVSLIGVTGSYHQLLITYDALTNETTCVDVSGQATSYC